jgi:hypothetical protein
MSRMQIYVFFDEPEDNYRCGDTITGRIKVTASEDTRIEQLKVTPMWRTHGRGNKAQGKLTAMKLFSGTWHRGETYEYFFSFETPSSPHTYAGDLVNVDWFLHIHPDVPFELDHKLEENFVLKPALDSPMKPRSTAGCARWMPFFSILFMLPFMAAGLFFMYIAKTMVFDTGETTLGVGIFVFLFAGLFVLIPALSIIKLGKTWLTSFMLGGVCLTLDPKSARPGGALKVLITCKPRMRLNSLTIQADVSAHEEATSGSGTNSSTYNHTLFEDGVPKVFGGELKANTPFSHTLEFVLPDITPSTIHLRDNNVTTAVKIKLRTDRFTWEGSQEVIVGSIE